MAAYTTIDNPELFFQCKLYTGTGSEIAATLDGDENMQPDLVWIKARTDTESHKIYDSVRGATKHIESDTTDAEATEAQGLKSFDSDGFTIGTYSSINASSSHTYVAWCWKESATAGFDIVAYTGSGSAHTISHSLSAVPSVVILKGRSFGDGWGQYHKTSGNPAILAFDGDVADRYSSKWGPFFNSTAPTSSVFSVGTDTAINTSSKTHIAYLFAEKQGFSKFGSYKGNGNADGPFVYTGFRPAMVIIRNSSATGNWEIFDTKRSTYNLMHATLYADTNSAEYTGTGNQIDVLSNGFKVRNEDTNTNDNGETTVFMAFAEAPFVNSNGVPATAR